MPSYVPVIFIDMNIILQKGGISKHSGKQENFTIGLDSSYLFNLEHETEHEIDWAYGVCMHLTFLNFTTEEFDSLVVCNLVSRGISFK